jgi:amino acid permease
LAGGNINDIPTLVERLLGIVLTIGVPLIVLAISYAGFKFVTAQGKPDKLEEAKKTFLWILIGAAILLSAYAIAQGIKATIADIRGN